MATSYSTRDGRQKILEGLWLIGIEPGQLNIDPGLEGQAFLDALHRNGVHDEFISRAIRGVDWRSDQVGGSLGQRIENLLRTAGYRPDEIDAFNRRAIAGMGDAGYLQRILTEQFNERTAGAMIYKATGGKPPAGAVWNPFRTDTPPKNVDVKYGAGGMAAGVLPPGWQSIETPTRQVSTPPGVVQPTASARAGVPPMPGTTVSGQRPPVPGAGATPGSGAPGGGGPGGTTPLTSPVVEKLTPQQRRERLESMYGWAAALADIPEVNAILSAVANGDYDEITADRKFKATDYYKSTTEQMRQWRILQKTDPADAERRKAANRDNIANLARAAGIQNPDQRRLEQINDMALSLGWSDAEVRRALAAEVRYDPSGAMTGTLAELKNTAREWLVPLSDQAMTAWGQSIVAGDKTMDDFIEYNRQQAKSLFPALGAALDDPKMTVRQYLDPYAQDTAELLGVNAGDIDWKDPKYMRAFNQIDPKTNQRTIMSRADWMHTLMNDQQYGFDKTVKGQELRQTLTQSLMQSFGFQDFT